MLVDYGYTKLVYGRNEKEELVIRGMDVWKTFNPKTPRLQVDSVRSVVDKPSGWVMYRC